jgi:transcriptional regulator with XRE-family HTH domain
MVGMSLSENGLVGLQAIVAANVKRLRLRLGLSQEQLAEVCGYHRTYIGSIERGERNITILTLEAVAVALRVKPADLLVSNG